MTYKPATLTPFERLHSFSRPMPVDSTELQKSCVKTFRKENQRRARTVDDEVREEMNNHLACGEFDLSKVTQHKTWQSEYLDRFGKFIPINSSWRCPHCGTLYQTGYPPEECQVCHTISPFGELVRNNYFNR